MTIRLDDDLHYRLKLLAVKERTTVREMLTQLIRDRVNGTFKPGRKEKALAK